MSLGSCWKLRSLVPIMVSGASCGGEANVSDAQTATPAIERCYGTFSTGCCLIPMLDLPDKGFQSPGVVVLCVLGAEEERDVLLPSPLCDVAYVSHLARLFQFGAVALFELF